MRLYIFLLCLSLVMGGCASQAQSGAGLGALAGATIGALTFKNKISGAALGAGTGLLIGYMFGNERDKFTMSERRSLAGVFEYGESGHDYVYRNPDSGHRMMATPSVPLRQNGRIYRDVYITTEYGERIKARAYRDDRTGDWVLVQ
jgi:hypothetical protein